MFRNGFAHAIRRGEIRVVQRNPDTVELKEAEFDLAFDDSPVFDPRNGRHAIHNARGIAIHPVARGRNGALPHGIDLTIRARQRGDQQGAAPQTCRISKRRDGDIDGRAAPRKRGQLGRHHHGGGVLGFQRLAIKVRNAKPFKHPTNGFTGERAGVQLVPRPQKPNDEAISDQMVFPHTFKMRNILDPDLGPGRHRGHNQQCCGGKGLQTAQQAGHGASLAVRHCEISGTRTVQLSLA